MGAGRRANRSGGCAVVVGGAGDIGYAVADVLVRQPWLDAGVVIADIDEQAAAEAAARLGPTAHPLAVDVTKEDSIDALCRSAGNVDFLVVAAGIFDSVDSLSYSSARFERVVMTNLVGSFACARAFAKDLTRPAYLREHW